MTRARTNRKFGLPVREADKPMAMPLLQVDIEKAQKVKARDVNAKDNFMCCVLAQAVTRTCGAGRVAILRGVAYVAFPGEGHTKRYDISKKSRAILEAFDRGDPIVEGFEIRLEPPAKSRTLVAMRKQYRYRKYEARTGRKASTPRKTARKQRPSDPLHNVVRNGNLVRWA